jgi:ribonuclease I
MAPPLTQIRSYDEFDFQSYLGHWIEAGALHKAMRKGLCVTMDVCCRLMRKLAGAILCAVVFASSSAEAAEPVQLIPATNGKFGHYTFALTWQPGICSVYDDPQSAAENAAICLPDQPHSPLIGLHGLWASLPQSLIRENVPEQQWWSRGCDFYYHSAEAPELSADLESKLAAVMPHFRTSLLTHEYDKHVQCFGFDPTLFFTTELAMRQSIVDASFGHYLVGQAGQTVAHVAVVTAFETSFNTTDARSLQLQCGRDTSGRQILRQFSITIRADGLSQFPEATSLTDTPIDQDTCPATFLIPAW